MCKKLCSLLLCVVLGIGIMGTAASAAVVDGGRATISPYYTYLDTIVPTLSISGGKATTTGNIRGYSNVTKIAYTVTLQAKNGSSWSDVQSWSGSASGTRATYSYTSGSLTSGKTYRTKTVATIYVGSSSETVTAYSTEKTA